MTPNYTTKNASKIFIGLFISVGLFIQGCATTKLIARPDNDVTVTPNGTFAIAAKEGIVLSVAHIKTPNSMKSITTFFVEVTNNTDNTVEFIPKPYLLFDQSGAQYMAMGPNALAESSASGSFRRGYYSMGFGHGPYGSFHSHSLFYSYPGYYVPHYSGRSYHGLIAKALPVHPMTIHPHTKVSGNVYFAVNPKYLQNVELLITRMAQMPRSNEPPPRDINYRFAFDVVH